MSAFQPIVHNTTTSKKNKDRTNITKHTGGKRKGDSVFDSTDDAEERMKLIQQAFRRKDWYKDEVFTSPSIKDDKVLTKDEIEKKAGELLVTMSEKNDKEAQKLHDIAVDLGFKQNYKKMGMVYVANKLDSEEILMLHGVDRQDDPKSKKENLNILLKTYEESVKEQKEAVDAVDDIDKVIKEPSTKQWLEDVLNNSAKEVTGLQQAAEKHINIAEGRARLTDDGRAWVEAQTNQRVPSRVSNKSKTGETLMGYEEKEGIVSQAEIQNKIDSKNKPNLSLDLSAIRVGKPSKTRPKTPGGSKTPRSRGEEVKKYQLEQLEKIGQDLELAKEQLEIKIKDSPPIPSIVEKNKKMLDAMNGDLAAIEHQTAQVKKKNYGGEGGLTDASRTQKIITRHEEKIMKQYAEASDTIDQVKEIGKTVNAEEAAKVEGYMKQIAELQEQINAGEGTRTELSKAKQDIDALMQQMQQASAAYQQLNSAATTEITRRAKLSEEEKQAIVKYYQGEAEKQRAQHAAAIKDLEEKHNLKLQETITASSNKLKEVEASKNQELETMKQNATRVIQERDAKYQKELKDLQTKIKENEQIVEDLKKDGAEAHAKSIANYEKHIAKLNSRVSELDQENKKAQSELVSASQMIKEQDAKYQKELKGLQSDVKFKEKMLEKLKANNEVDNAESIKKYESQLAELKSRVNTLNQERDTAQRALAEHQKLSASEKQSMVTRYEKERELLQGRIAQQDEHLQTLSQHTTEESRKMYAELQEERRKSNEELMKKNRDITQLTTLLKEQQQRSEVEKSAMARVHEGEKQQLREEIASRERAIEMLNQTTFAANSVQAKELARLRGEKSQLEAALNNKDRELGDLKVEADRTISGLRSDLESTRNAMLRDREQQRQSFMDELERTKKEYAASTTRMSNKSIEDRRKLHKRALEFEEEKKELEKKVGTLTAQIETIKKGDEETIKNLTQVIEKEREERRKKDEEDTRRKQSEPAVEPVPIPIDAEEEEIISPPSTIEDMAKKKKGGNNQQGRPGQVSQPIKTTISNAKKQDDEDLENIIGPDNGGDDTMDESPDGGPDDVVEDIHEDIERPVDVQPPLPEYKGYKDYYPERVYNVDKRNERNNLRWIEKDTADPGNVSGRKLYPDRPTYDVYNNRFRQEFVGLGQARRLITDKRVQREMVKDLMKRKPEKLSRRAIYRLQDDRATPGQIRKIDDSTDGQSKLMKKYNVLMLAQGIADDRNKI